jgi:hypothetical protein
METQEEKKHAYDLEKNLKEFFTRILDSAQEATSNVEKHIQMIVKTLKGYKRRWRI